MLLFETTKEWLGPVSLVFFGSHRLKSDVVPFLNKNGDIQSHNIL